MSTCAVRSRTSSTLQVRAKDSRPYHPIFSTTYGRYVSNKNYAFYFKKDFAKYLQTLSPHYPFDPQRYERRWQLEAWMSQREPPRPLLHLALTCDSRGEQRPTGQPP